MFESTLAGRPSATSVVATYGCSGATGGPGRKRPSSNMTPTNDTSNEPGMAAKAVVTLVQETFLERFPPYPERRIFRVRCIGDPPVLAECSEVEHSGTRWRIVRLSAEDGIVRQAHVELVYLTFFSEGAEVDTEGNPQTGRVRLSQKLPSDT